MAYDFKVIHRKGTNNIVPDALSRMFEDGNATQICSINIRAETSDAWYKKRAHQIMRHPRRYNDWKIIDNRIYRLRPDTELNLIIDDLDAWKLVVPEEKRNRILNDAHEEPTAAHSGVEKTYKRIAQAYYWPGMYKEITQYVKSCEICQRCITDQQGQIGLMGTMEIDKPWKVIAADLMEELPRSKSGYEYLMIVEDLFSRYIVCISLRKKTGINIRNVSENNICANFGTPEIFISDNGKEFINDTVKQFLNENAIYHERSASYSGQNNPVERINRDMKTRIAAYIKENHKEWDKYIPQFQFAHNTNVHSTTGKTPAFLICGRELHPLKMWKREAETQKSAEDSASREEIVESNTDERNEKSDD